MNTDIGLTEYIVATLLMTIAIACVSHALTGPDTKAQCETDMECCTAWNDCGRD
jgi:hypothetical protein